MYEEHLKRLEQNFGKFLDYPDAEPLEKCIILLKRRKMTYKQIQNILGNPSKEIIKSVILKYEPELLNVDCNQNKLQSNKNQIEQRVIGLIRKYKQFVYDLDEFDDSEILYELERWIEHRPDRANKLLDLIKENYGKLWD